MSDSVSAPAVPFDALTAALAQGGPPAVLGQLAEFLLGSQRYRELFAVRQMQVRQRLGLPPHESQLGELAEPVRSRLEEGYVAACREIGRLLLTAGRIRESWPYWNVVGDKPAVRAELAQLTPSDEQISEFIEVALYEGVWPERGAELMLQHQGTCNTITTLDGMLHSLPPPDRAAVVRHLVRRVHGDLLANLRYDLERQQGSPPAETTLAGLVAERDWLFNEYTYHIDTSHLSATVRLAKVLLDSDDLRLAVDLTEYGRRLSATFQFKAEEPFAEFYPSHGLYLRAMTGEQMDEAVAYFRRRAEEVPVEEEGPSAVEFYVALLDRIGRPGEAVDELIRLLPATTLPVGIAPPLAELAARSGRFDRLLEVCSTRDDPVGYAVGLLARQAALHQ